VTDPARVRWHLARETRFPFGTAAPDPDRWEPIGFPPPWDDRPWLFGVMVSSANGVVAWRQRGPDDLPVSEIVGPAGRPDRRADRLLMRWLRCFGDMAIGAETTRVERGLVQTPQEAGDEPAPELYRFRTEHGLPHHPRTIVYSLFGRLVLSNPVFSTPGLDVIVVTTAAGAAELARRGAADKNLALIVEPLLEPGGLRRAHRRLFAERGVRYLDCEGGMTVLRALRAAGLLDEVFLSVTDVVVDESRHDGVIQIFDFPAEGASLVAEGRIPDGAFTFQRWRFSDR
jgi:riboflavin biosynthesis pyrimidine reductase